ncbi:serine O-acetyltransferase [Psychroflexus sediminis]|uniref:Serine acetyltransferase n=1 Tax=Psychroflexus sediminis TaxID=470826 RepID=A0A1G7Z3Y5_9FLAO|nr:serine acetyltransferase [Psychroflexus sediminis]SDH03461.1 serine O-acetyltransferase [Psychroflexus sediminis]
MKSLFKLLKTDYSKYKKYGGNFFTIFFFTQGFWAILQYRLASSFYYSKLPSFIKQVLLFCCLIWQKAIEIVTGISIPASVKIGHSFYIGHFGNIILNATAIIGDNCNISQGVTIGVSGLGKRRGVPVIGNNVYIGANAVIAGKINIGNNTIVGANSLVNKDFPNNSVLLGVPAQLIKKVDSNPYI